MKADVHSISPTKNAWAPPTRQRDRMHKYWCLFFLKQQQLTHVKVTAHPSIECRARAHRTRTNTHTHAQGIRDSAAVLITSNGSIRRTVMIKPVESLPLHSVTCRGPRLLWLTGGAPGPPWPWWPAGPHKVTWKRLQSWSLLRSYCYISVSISGSTLHSLRWSSNSKPISFSEKCFCMF